MKAQTLLDRLNKVRSNGRDRWMACCPAHKDSNPSLSVRETEDGKVLVNCFSHGCNPADIISAVGLTWDDLFTEAFDRPERKPRPRSEVEVRIGETLKNYREKSEDELILEFCAGARRAGRKLTPADLEREKLAFQRVHGVAA